VIEGLRVDLTSEELTTHLHLRGVKHAEKAAEYEKQVVAVSELQPASGASNDPVQSLRMSAQQHRAKAALFDFLAKHIVPNETYRLSEQEFIRLEFVDAVFF
jgi:hypothetical protein